MLLVNQASGIKYKNSQGISILYKENSETENHYFSPDGRIYSDKVSKFVCRCNERSKGAVIKRLTQIYSHIFIDEVQDLAGYDLELIKLLMAANLEIFLVGDPRQVTYLTHNPKKYTKYRDGKIKDFISAELSTKIFCEIDETTLATSHRNNQEICDLASKLHPDLPPSNSCECPSCLKLRDVSNRGIYLVHPDDVEDYLRDKSAIQLRWDRRVETSISTKAYNFGNSKGMGFDHVLIYPTDNMKNWIFDTNVDLNAVTRAKLYVAITRARHSVAFVCDKNSQDYMAYNSSSRNSNKGQVA